MSFDHLPPMDRSDIPQVARDQQRLLGCMALRLNPDFDITYFELVETGLFTKEQLALDLNDAIFEYPDALSVDPSITAETSATILGMTNAYMNKLLVAEVLPSETIDQRREVRLSVVEHYIRDRIETTKRVFGK